MDAIGAGSERTEAFDAAYDTLFDELTRLCLALGAGGAAEDVAQEALIDGRAKLAQLRDPGALRPWLRTIAVRRFLRARSRRGAASLDVEPAFLPHDPGLGLDAAAAIARLPERERLAVILVYGLGYQQEEVADMLGIRRGTVAASLWEARRKLARDLAAYRGGDEQ